MTASGHKCPAKGCTLNVSPGNPLCRTHLAHGPEAAP